MEKNVAFLTQLFDENRNEAQASPIKKYMKDLFPFLGIKKPLIELIPAFCYAPFLTGNAPFHRSFAPFE